MDDVEDTPFNGLTPGQVELLVLLGEEAAEIVQAAAKVLRHGYESRYPADGSTNRETLQRELGDLFAAVSLLVSTREIGTDCIAAFAIEKFCRVGQFLHHVTLSARTSS